jgi:magnesium transporter
VFLLKNQSIFATEDQKYNTALLCPPPYLCGANQSPKPWTAKVMVQYFFKEQGKLTLLSEPRPGAWIHIVAPFSTEELEEIAERFDFHVDFLTDSLDIDERPRFDRDEDVRHIVVQSPVLNENREDEAIYITVPIGIVLTPNHVITVSPFESPVLEQFIKNRVKNFDPSDSAQFVLQIMEQNVFRFLNCLKKLNLKRNMIEKELYHSSRSQELRSLLTIEKSLVYFVNALSANELMGMKMKRTDFLQLGKDEDKLDLLEDILIDTKQALEMANIYTNILNGTMDAYSSIISNNLNIIIQRLTLVTIILYVPTLIASLFGMNVPLPFPEENWSFYAIVLIAIVCSLLLAWFFRRRNLF